MNKENLKVGMKIKLVCNNESLYGEYVRVGKIEKYYIIFYSFEDDSNFVIRNKDLVNYNFELMEE